MLQGFLHKRKAPTVVILFCLSMSDIALNNNAGGFSLPQIPPFPTISSKYRVMHGWLTRSLSAKRKKGPILILI